MENMSLNEKIQKLIANFKDLKEKYLNLTQEKEELQKNNGIEPNNL